MKKNLLIALGCLFIAMTFLSCTKDDISDSETLSAHGDTTENHSNDNGGNWVDGTGNGHN